MSFLSFRNFSSFLIWPAILPILFWTSGKTDNQPPTAVDDTYTVHGCPVLLQPAMISNDSDPDGDYFFINEFPEMPAHGGISFLSQTAISYCAGYGHVGPDSFTYKICDSHLTCSTGRVTLDIVNQPPAGGADSYDVHFRATLLGPFLVNDSDPDGDSLGVGDAHHDRFVQQPQHGTLFPANAGQNFVIYTPADGYSGPDSFTYNACDSFGLCSETTVNINVTNNAPAAGDDAYRIPGPSTLIGPFLENDSDPDGDGLVAPVIVDFPQHGNLFALRPDRMLYSASPEFAGTDSFTYRLCDDLGKCSIATVTLYVIGDGVNDGACDPCNGSVGGPINVTNGNMYLQQLDYALPSIGPAINLTRTFNSNSQSTGLFGRGWSSPYDESILAYDGNLTRLNRPDGRAIYLGRQMGAAGAYASLERDFHGQLSGGGESTLTMKDGSVHQFSPEGRLLSLADRNGNQTTLNYLNNRLASITDPFGRVLTVATNGNGQVSSVSDSSGTIATYVYGAGDELLSVTYPDNSAFRFAYDGNFRLTTVTDALGNVIESHTYDNQGRAITSAKHDSVEQYTLSYMSDNETGVTDGLGRFTRYTFDKSRGRNVVTQVEGLCNCGASQVQSWTYDDQLNVTSTTDALGHLTSYTYDANGNRLTQTNSTGTVTFTYNGFSELLTGADQLNHVTTNTYDTQGNLLTVTNALGKTASFTYGQRGLLLTVTDARGKLTTFTYDASGNLIKKTNALNHDTQFAYDARARLTSTTNALGHSTTFGYDAFGRVNLVTQADGTTISYEYDLAGRRTAVTDAKGNRSTFAYDGSYRLTSQTDAANQTTSYSYDAMSNLISVTDTLSRVTNIEYDEFNRMVKTTLPPATTGATPLFQTSTYDAAGNVTQQTDTAGRVTSYVYDEVNRVTSTTDAANQTTNFEYDALSRMTALVDAIGQRYRFNYDAIGQLKKMHRGSEVMSFTYDPVGNRKTRTDYNGSESNYSYDALNRLKTISYPDSTTVSYTYDKLSRLQTATNENGAVNFDYNKMNRVTAATDVFGQLVDYHYDANGNRTKLGLNSAIVETYKYDTVDRLTKILDAAGAAFTFDYDPASRLTQKKQPNGVKTTYQYDGLDRLTRLLDTKGVTTVADHQYQYNAASQITQIAEPTVTRNYGYDLVDRLTSASYTNPIQPNESYTYDGVGNRRASQVSASYTYQRFNRLTSTSTGTYAYDLNGNLISKTDSNGTTLYSWDFENRLKQVTLPNGSTVAYKYDALGRRIQRTPSTGVATNFVYDGQDVVKDINSDGPTVDYLNGLGVDNKLRLTDSRLAGTGPLYFLQDQLGSTTGFTNSLGAAVSQISYDSFGNANAGANLTRYTYTGREYDSTTGLYYYRARWYDPKVGRFISEDPIGFGGGINQFGYVGNNPQNGTDPSGLHEIDVHYYLTYYLAMKTGCFSEAEAREIANGNQGVDENPATSPGYGSDERQRQVNAYYHTFHSGSHKPYLLAHWKTASMIKGGSLPSFGIYLHYLQDIFSHRGYTDSTRGHASGTHAVDKTDEDVEKATRMARATWDALLRFAKWRGCKCHSGPGSDDMWRTVEEFSKAPGGNFYSRRRYSIDEINPWYLNNKIGILDVPRR